MAKKIDFKKILSVSKGHSSTYSSRFFSEKIPEDEMPKKGMPADAVYQLIHDELNMDGNPALNLATFVTTWMEPEADKIIAENRNKNFIDHDEYPQTKVIEQRVVKMLAKLYNAPKNAEPMGVSTVGSSEAIMLALLAHKWSWRNKRKKMKKPYNKPNIVMGADVHTVWDKYARYFDVEPRIIPMHPKKYTITVEEVAKQIDENTICVGAILGTTFTGQWDPIKEINDYLLKIKKTKGWDIPIHVDGASGAFIAPFTQPQYKWDFRLEQVRSINTSGHKYGLVYPGLGWVIFKDKKYLPEDLIFNVNYLGGQMPTFTLNFSKGSSMVLAQYYNLLRLGKEGYRKIMENSLKNAQALAKGMKKMGRFEFINEGKYFPLVAVKLKSSKKFNVYNLSDALRERGWIVPAYTLPPNAEKIEILRVVIKENFSRDMVDIFLNDLDKACKKLEGKANKKTEKPKGKERKIC